MIASSRGILAIGLGLTGLAILVAPTLGQGQAQDDAVRKATNPASVQKPPHRSRRSSARSISSSFSKTMRRSNNRTRNISAALMARKNELMKIMSEAQEEAQMLSKLAPGTEDYRKHENRVTQLKAQHEAGREQAEREFAMRQAEAMATLYKEIQEMVKKVAQWHNMNYIVKVSSQPITGTDPNSVMAAISSTLVYGDPRNDITSDVIHNLNRFYKATAAPSAKSAAGPAVAPGNPANAAQPDGN